MTKQWVSQPAKSVEVLLHADDVQKETVTLSHAKGWEHIFKDLAKYYSMEVTDEVLAAIKEQNRLRG